MARREFTVDTRQLERLSGALAALPRDLTGAVSASVRSAALESLRNVVMREYALSNKGLSGSFRLRRVYDGSTEGFNLRFELAGRRLSGAHFNVKPMSRLTFYPMIEIIRGEPRRLERQEFEDGLQYSPFIMETGAASNKARFPLNVFYGAWGSKKLKHARWFGIVTKSRKAKMRVFRTLAVPQMLGNENVAGDVQTELLSVFDRELIPRIEKRLDLTAEAVVKG